MGGGGAMQLGSELFYGVIKLLDLQETRCFLADGGIDLFGGRQVFLYWRDGPPNVMWGPRGGVLGPANGLRALNDLIAL